MLLIAAASEEGAVDHTGFDGLLGILGKNEILKAPADFVSVFAVVIGKCPYISAGGYNHLKQLIPKSSVRTGNIIGIILYLHTETGVIILKDICKVGDENIPVGALGVSVGVDPIAHMVEHGITAHLLNLGGSGPIVVLNAPFALAILGEVAVDVSL